MSPEHKRFRVWSPRKSNAEVRALLHYLELEESTIVLLKYRRPQSFEPEPNNCFFNVWVQCLYSEGSAQHGWIIGQDRANQFTEAQFHSVWRSPRGDIRDVTPRPDNEKRIMFVPDTKREIHLIQHNGQPAIESFDNVRIWNGQMTSPLTSIIVLPETEMISKYGLAEF